MHFIRHDLYHLDNYLRLGILAIFQPMLLVLPLQPAQWAPLRPPSQLLLKFRNLLAFFSTLPGYIRCQPLPLSLLLLKQCLHFYFVLACLKSAYKSLVFAGWTTWYIRGAALHYPFLCLADLMHLTAHAVANTIVYKFIV